MKVRWTALALDELERAFAYINQHSPKSADKVAKCIAEQAESLSTFPLRGKQIRRNATRKLSVSQYPYIIVYRVVDGTDEVQILNVRHTSRQPPATDD